MTSVCMPSDINRRSLTQCSSSADTHRPLHIDVTSRNILRGAHDAACSSLQERHKLHTRILKTWLWKGSGVYNIRFGDEGWKYVVSSLTYPKHKRVEDFLSDTPTPPDISGGRYFDRAHAAAARPYGHNTTRMKVGTECWWNYNDRGYRCAGGGDCPTVTLYTTYHTD
jgi:hypothetical protein